MHQSSLSSVQFIVGRLVPYSTPRSQCYRTILSILSEPPLCLLPRRYRLLSAHHHYSRRSRRWIFHPPDMIHDTQCSLLQHPRLLICSPFLRWMLIFRIHTLVCELYCWAKQGVELHLFFPLEMSRLTLRCFSYLAFVKILLC